MVRLIYYIGVMIYITCTFSVQANLGNLLRKQNMTHTSSRPLPGNPDGKIDKQSALNNIFNNIEEQKNKKIEEIEESYHRKNIERWYASCMSKFFPNPVERELVEDYFSLSFNQKFRCKLNKYDFLREIMPRIIDFVIMKHGNLGSDQLQSEINQMFEIMLITNNMIVQKKEIVDLSITGTLPREKNPKIIDWNKLNLDQQERAYLLALCIKNEKKDWVKQLVEQDPKLCQIELNSLQSIKKLRDDSQAPILARLPFFFAFSSGKYDIGFKLLDLFPKAVNIPDSNGDYPLHWAVDYNKTDMIKQLIEKYKANPNISNADGNMPAHIAVEQDNLAALKMLFAAGADMNVKPSLAEIAVEYGSEESLEFLCNQPNAQFLSSNLLENAYKKYTESLRQDCWQERERMHAILSLILHYGNHGEFDRENNEIKLGQNIRLSIDQAKEIPAFASYFNL